MKTLLSATFGASLLATATLASAEPVSYTIDVTHAGVTAESRHFGASTVRTHFMTKGGTIVIDTAAKTGKVETVIDINTAYTGVPKLDAHLKTDQFLDAAGYPEAKFVGTKFTFDGDKVASIAGDLTLRGKTNPITLKATNYTCYMSPNFKKQVCGGDFETTIKRNDWDIKYLIPFVSDETRLVVQIEAIKD